MHVIFSRAAALLFAASLAAGCSTIGGRDAVRPVDVTTFHLGQPIARGEIAIEPLGPPGANSMPFAIDRDAVARHLARLGWTVVVTPGRSEQVALIEVRQGSREAFARRSPVTIGIGGSTGGWRSGLGVGATFGIGGGGSRDFVATILEVRIKRHSDDTVFWEGRAASEARADSIAARRPEAVERLAEALFRDFPGESGRTIRRP